MKVEITDGYIILLGYVTRKAQRDFNQALWQNAQISRKDTEEGAEAAADNIKFNPMNYAVAAETMALELIQEVYKKNEAGEFVKIEKTQEWWDNLREDDAIAIENAVIKLKKNAEQDSKKS